MKSKVLFTVLFTILFAISISAQKVGITTDAIVGSGIKRMANTIAIHGGVTFGVFYSPKKGPFTFGYRHFTNSYGSLCKNELPFYREDYVHDVANISNTHSIAQNILFTRVEFFKNKGISPFVEGGAGYANYKSKWTATDPYESHNDNCEGYLDQGTYYKSGTFIANATAGVNFKLNKLSGKNNCSGVWLTIAVDYSVGGKVSYLNSKINNNQFYYDQGQQVLTGVPRSATGHLDNSSVSTGLIDQNYFNQSSYSEKHELIQVRIGLSMVIGNCK